MKKDRRVLKFVKTTEESLIPTASTELITENATPFPMVEETESGKEPDQDE